jgi:hypothetical protein
MVRAAVCQPLAARPRKNVPPDLSEDLAGCGSNSEAKLMIRSFSTSMVRLVTSETKRPHENPPVRPYLHGTGKSLFV